MPHFGPHIDEERGSYLSDATLINSSAEELTLAFYSLTLAMCIELVVCITRSLLEALHCVVACKSRDAYTFHN